MNNLLTQLAEALTGLDEAYCRAGSCLTDEERAEDRKRLIAARAAISAVKDGGWVLPEGKRVIVVDDSFDQLIYWVDRAVSKGNANSDIQDAYEAWTGWDTWPLPNPPKEQNI